MTFPPDEVKQLVQKIAEILIERNQTLAISEAACGGLLSAYLVSVPGASQFYIGGKLVYSLKQRLKLSGWSDEDVANYMGPSRQVALKLARTTKYELGSTYVLSETGFAGPSTDLHLSDANNKIGGEETHTNSGVGTVYIGISGPKGDFSQQFNTGVRERSSNMTQFAKLGLEYLLQYLQEQEVT